VYEQSVKSGGFQGELESLRRRIRELEAIEAERQGSDSGELAAELVERCKELDCLYSISSIVERPGITLKELLAEVVEALPTAWRFSEAARARIILEDKEFRSIDFVPGEWTQQADISIGAKKCGRIEVVYNETVPCGGEGPFLAEEARLLGAVAERLGRIIERMRNEKALRDEKDFTEHVLNALTDAFYVVGINGDLIRWNRVLSREFGYTDEELSSMNVLDFFEGDDAERQRDFYETLLGNGRGGIESTTVTKDGRRIPYYFQSTLLRDVDGRPYAICGVGRDITEQKRAREAMRVSEERYRDIFENASDLIQSVTPEGRYLYVNRAWRGALGYTEEEIKNLTVEDVIHPEDLEHCLQVIREVMDGKEARSVEARFISRDGEEIMVEGSASCHFEEGKPIYTRGIFRDISERRKMEEALKTSEQYFRSLIENAYDAVTVLNPDGSMRYTSPSFERMTGYKPDELIGLNAFEFIHSEDIPNVLDVFTEGQKEPHKTATAEYRFHHADGSWHYVEAVGRNLLADPAVQGIVVNYRDVTLKREIENALRESEEKFRTIAGTARDAIIMINDEGKISYWNPAAEKIFGYRSEEVMGEDMHKIIVPQAKHENYLREMSSFGKDGRGSLIGTTREMTGMAKGGERIPIETSLSSLLIGGRWHALGIARDISERKKAEEALRAVNRELETFAHTLSHDLRSPLSFAYGYAFMLQNRKLQQLDRDGREWLDEIVLSLIRMDNFITSLLEYARAGQPGGETTRVEPGKIIDEVLKELGTGLRESGLEVTIDGELPAVRVDAVKLGQVLTNLISNSIKYAETGSPLRIAVGSSVDGDEVTFHISDNGRGIPEEKLETIFEPFTRLQSGDSSNGLGIGLSTVKRAVEGWGGRVWAESPPGEGATFHFTAPSA
jgi:PAS domain S-box-containing protein